MIDEEEFFALHACAQPQYHVMKLPIQDVAVPLSSLGFREANGNQGGVSIGVNLQLGEHGECVATYVAGVPTLSAAEAATFLQEDDNGPPIPPEYQFPDGSEEETAKSMSL